MVQTLNNDDFFKELKLDCIRDTSFIHFYEQERGLSLLTISLYMGDIEFAEWLVDHGAEVNVLNDGTPLSNACFNGNPKIIKKILFKTNDDFKQKCNPLAQAIYSTKKSNVEVLLKNGYSVNEPDSFGYTPLYYAITAIESLTFHDSSSEFYLKRQLKIIDFLLNMGAELDETTKGSLDYLFELRDERNNRDILSTCSYFISKEKSLDKSKSLFHFMRWLLENGADAHHLFSSRKMNENRAAIMDSCMLSDLIKNKYDVAITELLTTILKHVNASNYPESIHFDLIFNSSSDSYVRLLLEHGFNPNSSNNGRLLLNYLIQSKLFAKASTLLNFEADIQLIDDRNRDVLCMILSNADKEDEELGALETFEKILKQKPDLLKYNLVNHVTNLTDDTLIEDIFDLAIARRVYHWFEPYLHYMSEDEKWRYVEKRLKNIMLEDNNPSGIHFH